MKAILAFFMFSVSFFCSSLLAQDVRTLAQNEAKRSSIDMALDSSLNDLSFHRMAPNQMKEVAREYKKDFQVHGNKIIQVGEDISF